MVTWLPNTDLVLAFMALHPCPIQNSPLVPSLNPPNLANPPNTNPRSNVNNRIQDPRIIGVQPLAKKIQRSQFADLIRNMNTKGHSVPKNAAGKPHCL